MTPARDSRVADLVIADRENLLGLGWVDANPARVLSVKQKVVLPPLRLELQASQGEPEGFLGNGDGVDAPALRVNGEESSLDIEVASLGAGDPTPAKAVTSGVSVDLRFQLPAGGLMSSTSLRPVPAATAFSSGRAGRM